MFLYKTFLNTKRGLLSLICSIFDPLGIVSPCLIEPKLVMHELWKDKIDWDEELATFRFEISISRMVITTKIHTSYFYKQILWYRHTH